MPRLLAKIGKARGAHALQIAAIGRVGQIEVEDLFLGEPPFDLDRAHHLQKLRRHRALAARLDQARHLHGERRTTRYDAAMSDELQKGSADRHGIDAVVVVEASVFIGDQHAQELRIDIGNAGLQPPASLGRGEGTQQIAIGVEHLGRNHARAVQRRRIGAVRGFQAEDQGHRRQGSGSKADRNLPSCLHDCAYCWAASTSMRPIAVRAENCGRYMSSTLAAGWS